MRRADETRRNPLLNASQLNKELFMSKSKYPKKKRSFAKDVAKGTAKGLGKLASDTAAGVAGELVSIFTLGLFKPPRRY
jgi:hypothetical protein